MNNIQFVAKICHKQI